MFNFILALSLAVTGGLHVDGLDGVVTLSDDHGNIMVVEADCARVISDAGISNLADVHKTGVTSTDAYIEACF